MRTNKKQTGEEKMKKVTFATLKKLARKGLLTHRVRGEHSVYGFKFYTEANGNALPIVKTTLSDLEKFKTQKNWIQTDDLVDDKANAQLSNCCFYVNFYFKGVA
tara:strand:+ start:229 stop:540 length:312 start_codon:yes stop_codon:yes gene_type:complete